MGSDLERQTPIRMKMKNLKRTIRGRLLAGSPPNETDRDVWESMGYEQLPTGDWYEPEEPLGPSLRFMRRYPHGHVCKACRDLFRSTRYHDAFCYSCRSIIELDRRKLESILDAHSSRTRGDSREALRQIQISLECPRCGWQANEGRIEPTNIQRIREYLEEWIVASHLHWMRHNFWNRFPTKPKFVPKEDWDEQVKMIKLFTDLSNYAKKNPNIIEITYSETGIPLYAEQKRSKYALEFPPAN